MMAVTQQSNYASVQSQQPPSASPYNFMNSAGMYVHSNPPRPLISSSTSSNSTQNTAIRNWIKSGDVDKLENVVLEGQGARLLGLMDSTSDVKVKTFLRGIPGYMAKVDLIHDAVIRGSVRELQTLLDKKKLSLARDAVGRGLAHKAVLHSQRNVLDWLGKKYPESIQIRDNESRTCLHYAGIAKNPTDMYNFLLNLGSNPEIVDIHGRKASYYLTNPQELYIDGVGGIPPIQSSFRGNKSLKRGGGGSQFRRRISPISPKSSPSPPTTTANSLTQPPQHSSAGSSLPSKSFLSLLGPSSPQLTRAQIRIWIHEKDISKLEQIVWSGNGDRLLLETTNNPKVRRFLDNVPYLLHHIKLIHTAAIHNDVEGLKEIRSRIERSSRGSGTSSDAGISISPELFTARDSYGLSPMHKATGLNNRTASEFLLYEFPSCLNLQDNFKRTPLHYAAARVGNDPQTSESVYKFLERAGADTDALDYKHHDPPFYLSRPAECDSFKFLRNIPDAPRVVSGDSLLGWDRTGVKGYSSGRLTSPGGNKRKISDEFGDSMGGSEGKLGEREEEIKPGSGGKVARTEEEVEEGVLEEDVGDEEIRDVGDGYVADSDEGKYDLQVEDVLIGEEDVLVEKDEEGEMEQLTREDDEDDNIRQVSPSQQQLDKQGPLVTADVQNSDDYFRNANIEEEDNSEKKAEVAVTSETRQEAEQAMDVPEDTGVPIRPQSIRPNLPDEKALSPEPTPSPIPSPSAAEVDERSGLLEGSGQQPPPDYTEVAGQDQPGRESPESSVDYFIATSDMESLVNLVLKGKGHDLIDKVSQNPEIQEFLHNVPAYMAKIQTIHRASYTGNMRDLQSLLDRKRLAEAQDEMGRAALHHAVLGGNSQIVRYLVNGYPGCIDVKDEEGRTALHYAAAVGDEGVLYRVLIQGGADPNLRDALGNTPGVYLRRKDLLKVEALMKSSSGKRTGVEIKGAERKSGMRSAKVDSWARPDTPFPAGSDANPSKNVSVITISPEEKGGEGPEEEEDTLELPIQNLSLLNSFYLEVLSKDSESIWSRTWKKLTTGNSGEIASKYVKRYLSPKVFHKIKFRSTPRYSSTLLDCIKFYPQFFIVAPDPHAYTCFAELFLPAISECNGLLDFGGPHPDLVLLGTAPLRPSFPIVDLPSKFIQQVRLRVSRNIRPFPFIPIMKREELYEIQKIVRKVFRGNDQMEWFDLEALEKDQREELGEDRGVWFPEATKISRFWPKGRGFLCDQSGSTQIWMNAEDHVDVVVVSLYGKLHPVMVQLQELMEKFKEVCDFHWNGQCGFLTVDPFRCGTGLKITFRLRLPNMMQNRSLITQKCDKLKLSLRWKQKYRLFGSSNEIRPDDWVEVENVQTCGLDENGLVLGVIESVGALIKEEEEIGRAIDRGMTKKKEHGSGDSGTEKDGSKLGKSVLKGIAHNMN